MKRFLVIPGRVRSRSDGDVHYIGFITLCRLYQVDPRQCVNADCDAQVHGLDTRGLRRLVPREDGRYDPPHNLAQADPVTRRVTYVSYCGRPVDFDDVPPMRLGPIGEYGWRLEQIQIDECYPQHPLDGLPIDGVEWRSAPHFREGET